MRMRNKLGSSWTNSPAPASLTRESADKFLCDLANVPDYDSSPDGPNARKDADGSVHVGRPVAVTDAWRRVSNLFRDLLPTHGNPNHERPNTLTGAPGVAWEDPDDPGYVTVEDLPPKLRLVWDMPMAQSRRIFLMCELAYYLRGPAMMVAATNAQLACTEERARVEQQGATTEQAITAGICRWSEVLHKETHDLQKMWIVSEADAFGQVLLRAVDVADRMRRCPTPACPAPYFIAQRRSQRYCSDACALPAQREFKRIWWREHGNQWRRKGKVSEGAKPGQQLG